MQERTPCNIRRAANEDLPAIIAITNAAFSVEDFLDGARTDEERILDYLKAGEFLVAEKAGRIVASVYIEVRGERSYFGMLAVDPSQQEKVWGAR